MMSRKNEANECLRERLMELAGMIKEKKEGTAKDMKRILGKFSLQEGVYPATARRYLQALKDAGLVVTVIGSRRWKYNPDEEWDQFTIDVDFNGGE